MGCYGIGPSRVMGAIAEISHDKNGLIWPDSVAPYQVHLVGLDLFQAKISRSAKDLYRQLQKQNIEVLYDDRVDVSAGAKFADADLIGIPIRLVISQRSLQKDGVELKHRHSNKTEIIPLKQIIDKIK